MEHMEQIKLFAIGGLDEEGKNCFVVDINDQWIVIEAGIKYPDEQQLGVEVVIPDFKFLVEHADKIKGIFITHAHDDVMGALPYLLKQKQIPVYTTPLTSLLIEDLVKKNSIKGSRINVIKRQGQLKLGNITIRTFGLTQSIADGFGLAIETKHGYIVYTSEFLIDFDIKHQAFSCDISLFAEIGKKGVLALLSESIGADKAGFTSPRHRLSDELDVAFEGTSDRVIVSLYKQNLFRLMEVIDSAINHGRKVVFHNATQRRYITHLETLGYYKLPLNSEIKLENLKNDDENVCIIVSSGGPNVFKILSNIALKEDKYVSLRETDTVIIGSPAVPHTEVEASSMENELYKEGVNVISFDHRKILAMHGSEEDIKMLLNLFKPKYYYPIKGQYRHMITNANLALNAGMKSDRIVILDNGQVSMIVGGELAKQTFQLTFEELFIDGMDTLEVGGQVLKDRESLASDGVMIAAVTLNFKTKAIIGGPDVQSRGVIYLKDADYLVKGVGQLFEDTIENLVKNNKYENALARKEARDKIAKFVYKETAKRPVILPVIVEINID